MAFGFRILPRSEKVAPGLVERFRRLPVANVSDSMSRMSAGGARLRPMHRGGSLAGPAFTVKCRPGDNLMLHKALDLAEPGDVIVVDAGGDLTNSMMGEIMAAHAQSRGIAGVIVNGAIRDADSLRVGDFPIFAAGVTHRGPYKDGPGEINVSVAIDGMVIAPGDLMLGDGDGVLCVPRSEAEEICGVAEARHAVEEEQIAAIKEGRPRDRTWVDATLKKLGIEV